MGIFSKKTSEDYNNKLESILEKKKFSSETKNLLLSMLYKIENSYEDYYKVKPVAETKKEFIEKLLYIIKEECEIIEIVTPKTKKSEELEAIHKNNIIDIKEGKIITYANEKDILYSLIALNSEYSLYKYYNSVKASDEKEDIIRARKKFLISGNAMNKSEVIRDFNGWSWNCDVKDIEDINTNLVYQNILILFGDKIEKTEIKEDIEVNAEDLSNLNKDSNQDDEETKIQNNEEDSKDVIKEAFESIFLKEKVEDILRYINVIILSNLAKEDAEVRYRIEKKLEDDRKKILLMQDNEKFLNTISKEKKKINEKIKKLDKMLNDRILLEEEYNKRNAKLSKQNKIFSVSHLANLIENERRDLLNEYRSMNKLLEPAEYIKEKDRLQKEYIHLKQVVDAICKEYAEEIVKDIQMEFLKCFKVKVEYAQTKTELLKLLYNFRYYCLLPINELQLVKDIPEFKDGIKDIINILIDKSIDKKVIENISNRVSLCYNTLKYVFESRIIDLEKIHIKVTKTREEIIQKEDLKEKIYYISISLYDYKEEEERHEEIVNNLGLLNIKLNRKTSLFI